MSSPADPPRPIAIPLTTPTGLRLAAVLRRPGTRRAAGVAGTVALVALAAWGAMHAIHPGALSATFAAVSWPWVVASGVAYAIGQICSAMVWSVGLSAGGIGGVDRRHVVGAHWIGHGAGELLPAQLGQVVRFAVLRRHPAAAAGGTLRIAGSIGAHKVVDGLVTFVVVAIATVAMPLPAGAGGLRWLALATLLGLLIALALVYRLGPSKAIRLLPRRLRGPVEGLGQGAALLARRRDTAAAIVLQLGAIAGRVVSLAALLRAFGFPAEAALLVFALLVLSGVICISPGGVGVREVALVPALVATYGLGTESALAFSLGVQATALAVSLVGAALSLVAMRLWPTRAARGAISP
jgi:uncharacterized membrane protein YbhN (UPF0104 family)